MAHGVGAMARPKKGAKRLAADEDRQTIINIKGSPEYANFVDLVNRKTHIPKAAMFRLAFADWCERNGHGTPPDL